MAIVACIAVSYVLVTELAKRALLPDRLHGGGLGQGRPTGRGRLETALQIDGATGAPQ